MSSKPILSSVERILLTPENTLLDTLRAIDDSALEIALVVDEEKRLLGTVTDGDIRRGLLRGTPLNAPISLLMNKNPIVAGVTTPDDELLFTMSQRAVKHLPIVDIHNHVMGLKRMQDLIAARPRPNLAVIMAGGRGRRLGALTDVTPKPLLPVADKPLLGIIINRLVRHGIREIAVTVHYKAEMIIAYLRTLQFPNVAMNIILEEEYMGTVGGLRLLPEKPTQPFLVMNGDLLTSINVGNLLDYHISSGYQMTVCAREFNFQIPYGVLDVKGGAIVGIEEKPTQKFTVNAGIYVLNPSLLECIPATGSFDMPDLIRLIVKKPAGIACFPLSEFWLDIGNPADYERAQTESMSLEL